MRDENRRRRLRLLEGFTARSVSSSRKAGFVKEIVISFAWWRIRRITEIEAFTANYPQEIAIFLNPVHTPDV